uniref:VASt domain-containing protein n=1 Tax=Dermatophagoides pteronyssinus TaxID=6956 RepID=A0A6P6XS58_DERPT
MIQSNPIIIVDQCHPTTTTNSNNHSNNNNNELSNNNYNDDIDVEMVEEATEYLNDFNDDNNYLIKNHIDDNDENYDKNLIEKSSSSSLSIDSILMETEPNVEQLLHESMLRQRYRQNSTPNLLLTTTTTATNKKHNVKIRPNNSDNNLVIKTIIDNNNINVNVNNQENSLNSSSSLGQIDLELLMKYDDDDNNVDAAVVPFSLDDDDDDDDDQINTVQSSSLNELSRSIGKMGAETFRQLPQQSSLSSLSDKKLNSKIKDQNPTNILDNVSIGNQMKKSETIIKGIVTTSITTTTTTIPAITSKQQQQQPIVANISPVIQPSTTTTTTIMNRKRRSNNFLSNIISVSYRQKSIEYYKLFRKNIGNNELLIGDFYCALNAIQGRMYISKDHFAFHHNIMGMFAKSLIWNCSNIIAINKANTALVIPNAIQLTVKQQPISISMTSSIINNGNGEKNDSDKDSSISISSSSSLSSTSTTLPINNNVEQQQQQKYLFTSFTQRDKIFALMETVWRRSNQNRSLSNQEISDLVHRFYGDDLGFMDDKEEQDFFAEEILANQIDENDHDDDHDDVVVVVGGVGGDQIDPLVVDIDQKTSIQVHQEKDQDQIKMSNDNNSTKSSVEIDQQQSSQISDELTTTIDTTTDVNFKSIIPIDSSTPIIQSKSINISPDQSLLNNTIEENEQHPPETIVTGEIAQEIIPEELNSNPTQSSINISSNNQIVTNEMKSLNRFFQAASLSMVEGCCRCSKHQGTLIVEKILPFPVDYLFELIFIDQNFIRYLHKTRQTTGMKITAWMPFEEKNRPQTPLPDGDYDICRSEYRTMKYTIKLTGMPLIKSATVFESQYILQSDLNRAYCLYTQIKNQGIPYSDSFLVSTTWCLNSCLPGDQQQQTATTTIQLPTHTKLRVYLNVHYIKNSLSLSLMKSSIEKNSVQGFQDLIGDLLKLLRTNRFDYATQSMLFNESSNLLVDGQQQQNEKNFVDKKLKNISKST